MPEVTVLTAVHNGAQYLPETIESVQRQSFKDWEYLLVDDASTDNTPAVIEDYARKDHRIKLIQRRERGGPFAAANEGLRYAVGKYIVRTDADDVSLPNRIQEQVEFLRSNRQFRACATYAQRIDDDSMILDEFFSPPLTSGSLKWYLGLRCELIHSSACVEKEAFLEIGGYKELPASQDYRMWCELSRRGWLAVVPQVLVYFRQHSGRISVNNTNRQNDLGREIAQEHLHELTDETWSLPEVKALYAAGLGLSFSIEPVLRALRRWDGCWGKDKTLTKDERKELVNLSARLRKNFLRRNARRQPISFAKYIYMYVCPRPSYRESQ